MTPEEWVQCMQAIRHLVSSEDYNHRAMQLLLDLLDREGPILDPSNHPPLSPRFSDRSTPQSGPGVRLSPGPNGSGNSGNVFNFPSPSPRQGGDQNNPVQWSTVGPNHPQFASSPIRPIPFRDRLNGTSGGSPGQQRGSAAPNEPGSWMQCPYCFRYLNMNLQVGVDEVCSASNSFNQQDMRLRITLLPEGESMGSSGSNNYSSSLNDAFITSSGGRGSRDSCRGRTVQDIMNRLPDCSINELDDTIQSVRLPSAGRYFTRTDLNCLATPERSPRNTGGQPMQGSQSVYIHDGSTVNSTIQGPPPAVRFTPSTRSNNPIPQSPPPASNAEASIQRRMLNERNVTLEDRESSANLNQGPGTQLPSTHASVHTRMSPIQPTNSPENEQGPRTSSPISGQFYPSPQPFQYNGAPQGQQPCPPPGAQPCIGTGIYPVAGSNPNSSGQQQLLIALPIFECSAGTSFGTNLGSPVGGNFLSNPPRTS